MLAERALLFGDADMAKKRKSNNPEMNSVQVVDHGLSENASGAAGDPRERIAARAYELYLQRGAGDGRATDDWLEAERELSQPSGQRNGG
jgi:Protein of unknown function (DUF2934)